MLTVKEFNKLYIAHRREQAKKIKLWVVKGFSIESVKTTKRTKILKQTDTGVPYYETVIEQLKKPIVKIKMDGVNGFNAMLVAYLKMFTPCIEAKITNTAGKWIPNVGYIPNRDKGRADITAQYSLFELCIETKNTYGKRKEKQLESQKKFEAMAANQTFRKYVLVRDFEDFQIKMAEIFNNLP